MRPFASGLMLVLFLAAAFLAQTSAVFSHAQGALSGYNPIAYFKDHEPLPGKKEISYSWQGAEWHFASLPNKEAFKANPKKYAPQYGG